MIQALEQSLQVILPRSSLQPTALPQCSAISLYLLPANYPHHNLSAEQVAKLMDEPPYWALCWASGQVLAAHLLAQPLLVRGKTVVDFGAGSGVVAIAAKKAGAARVIACDNDPVALLACRTNAMLNGVALEYCHDYASAASADVITVADVFYDRENLPLLADMQRRFREVWVSDSRLKGRPLSGLEIVASRASHTVPDMAESSEFNTVTLYRSL